MTYRVHVPADEVENHIHAAALAGLSREEALALMIIEARRRFDWEKLAWWIGAAVFGLTVWGLIIAGVSALLP